MRAAEATKQDPKVQGDRKALEQRLRELARARHCRDEKVIGTPGTTRQAALGKPSTTSKKNKGWPSGQPSILATNPVLLLRCANSAVIVH